MVELPLPPVERVRPGLWSIPVPIPNNPLRYVLVYAFETEKGPYLVDAGWNTDEAFDELCRGLVTAGFDIGDVQGVLVTHIHPDHYGLAGRIREASGAWVALHPADAALVHDRYEEPKPLVERMGELLMRAGAPEEEVQSLKGASMPVLPFVVTTHPDVLLEDGDKPEVPGWDLVSVWTPGHTAGHLCFYERDLRLMLSGDHVLPRITPNISVNPQAENPLVDYLASLDKVAEFETDEVLPAHEHRFVGLQARVNELKAHHEERFGEVIDAIESGKDTAWDITAQMRWSRSWDRINGWMRRAALGEALAHIRVLEARGVVRQLDGEPVRWEVVKKP
ncbi:MAG: MBL fold metallo-hydrolase [Acidimicrobiia bacterium]|nr:MBL fold metallo-hydrolase [Acidimicrobiia bacterium]MBV8985999.1 MBL fold metallo-hydrolase [Acidimicrobiia bacterium]